MNQTNKLLLLGATGRTGKEVLYQALSLGYQVNILVRDAVKVQIDHPNLKIFQGDTRSYLDLNRAADGCEAFISCLNISRESDFPWSPIRTPEDFLSMTMRNIINVCREKNIQRLVFTSAWGVGDSRPRLPSWFVWFIDNSNLSPAYLEHERQEALVRNSGLAWTIVRPVVLTNSPKLKPVKTILDNEKKPSLTISRKSTATFLIDVLDNPSYVHTAPTIFS